MKKFRTYILISLAFVAAIGFYYFLYQSQKSTVIVYNDIDGKKLFSVKITEDTTAESILGWKASESVEASPDSGLNIYFDNERKDCIYFYIANSNNTFKNILEGQEGIEIDSIVLKMGTLNLKKDSVNERIYGNISFGKNGYGAYLNMSIGSYNQHLNKIKKMINSYKVHGGSVDF